MLKKIKKSFVYRIIAYLIVFSMSYVFSSEEKNAHSPFSKETRFVQILPIEATLYALCCPAKNAENFANRLVKKTKARTISQEQAEKGYEEYLKSLLKREEKMVRDFTIREIMPVFRDMYEGIIEPYINIALEKLSNPSSGLDREV